VGDGRAKTELHAKMVAVTRNPINLFCMSYFIVCFLKVKERCLYSNYS
jgi:hypothetical protein